MNFFSFSEGPRVFTVFLLWSCQACYY